MSLCRFCGRDRHTRHPWACLGLRSKHDDDEVRDLRRRLARALWRIRQERHFFEDGVHVYSENLADALIEASFDLKNKARRRGR